MNNKTKITKYKAAVFDMDGTILDTVEDLKDALNISLTQFGYKADFTGPETCLFFGSGAKVAVARALSAVKGESPETTWSIGTPDNCSTVNTEDEAFAEILAFYKKYYKEHSAIKTCPYPGIPELVNRLSDAGIKTAVVSNKPDPAVQDLCRTYFPDMFSYAAGEISGIPRKPAPDMIHRVLAALGVSPEEAVYIGDSEVDIETAANSGLDCICVDWGFRPRDLLLSCGATQIVSTCDELFDLIAKGA